MLQILILRGKRGKGAKKGCEGVVSEEEEEEYLGMSWSWLM